MVEQVRNSAIIPFTGMCELVKILPLLGGVFEWLMELAWKACVR